MAEIKVGEWNFRHWEHDAFTSSEGGATFERWIRADQQQDMSCDIQVITSFEDNPFENKVRIVFGPSLMRISGCYREPTTFDNFDQAKQTIDEFLLRMSKLGAFE